MKYSNGKLLPEVLPLVIGKKICSDIPEFYPIGWDNVKES